MKRLLFTMMLIVAALAIWAQRWTPVNANSYSSEAIVYVQVTISGRVATANNPLEVSAFMDDKCRAQSTSIYTPATNTGPRNCYCLRIPGNPQEDANKAITFKVFYNGLVYIFSHFSKQRNGQIQKLFNPFLWFWTSNRSPMCKSIRRQAALSRLKWTKQKIWQAWWRSFMVTARQKVKWQIRL